MIKKILIIFLLIMSCMQLSAQSMRSTYFDMSEFPQWSRDLRRGEIVALGSFPFAYFFTTIFYDTYLYANNSWDTRYAPWPIKSSGAVAYTQDQHFATLGAAFGVAVTIAVVDHFIFRAKQNKQQRARNLIDESPIIIRRPLNEVSEDTGEQDNDADQIPGASPLVSPAP